jgi:hypothetical protein
VNATAKCHCGRPLGHTGKHIGSDAAKRGGPVAKAARRTAKDKLLAMIEAQIEAGVQAIGTLRRGIRESEKAIREKEAELAPLRAFAESYRNPRIEGPVPPALGHSTRVTRPVMVAEPPPAVMQDYDPIAADYTTVTAWATEHAIGFRSWDDLPRVNQKREALHLPTFKRALRPAKVA